MCVKQYPVWNSVTLCNIAIVCMTARLADGDCLTVDWLIGEDNE